MTRNFPTIIALALIGGAIGAVAGNLWSKRMEDKRAAMERATAGTGIEVQRSGLRGGRAGEGLPHV